MSSGDCTPGSAQHLSASAESCTADQLQQLANVSCAFNKPALGRSYGLRLKQKQLSLPLFGANTSLLSVLWFFCFLFVFFFLNYRTE